MKLWHLVLLVISPMVSAHDPGLSNATVDLGGERIVIQLRFAHADLELLSTEGSPETSLQKLAARAAEWRTGAAPAPLTVRSALKIDDTSVEIVLEGLRVPGEFHSALLPELPSGHRQVLVVRDHDGSSMRVDMLSAKHPAVMITQNDLANAGAPAMATVLATSPAETSLPWLAALALLPLLAYFWR